MGLLLLGLILVGLVIRFFFFLESMGLPFALLQFFFFFQILVQIFFWAFFFP